MRSSSKLLIFSVLLIVFFWPSLPVWAQQPGVAVLLFHSVQPEASGKAIMSVNEFDQVLTAIKENGYNFISSDQFHRYMKGTLQLPSKSVMITFDDGYEDNLIYAYPVLVKHQAPAIIFLVTKWYSPNPRPEKHLPHLTFSQINYLASRGLVAFGGHSHDGHYLTNESKEPIMIARLPGESNQRYQRRVSNDFRACRMQLNKLKIKTIDYAPPMNAYNKITLKAAGQQGFQYFYIQKTQLNTPGNTMIYRITSENAEQTINCLQSLYKSDQPEP